MFQTQVLTRIEVGSAVDSVIKAFTYALVSPFLVVWWLMSSLVSHWKPVALCAGTTLSVAIVAMNPMIVVAIGAIVLFGWITWPRG